MTDLSVVLPCYRAGALATASAARLASYLARYPWTWEIIVVDDGGGDVGEIPGARVIRLEVNSGKGAAVTRGMCEATGAVRVYTDIDLPYDLDLIRVIWRFVEGQGAHLVIGDRTLPRSRYHTELSAARRLASSVFSQFVGSLVTGGFFDTQCGLKGVRGDVADALFPLLRVRRFAFDVELVYVALKHRLNIQRMPVQLRSNETSSVRVVRDSLQAAGDVLAIKWHQLRGRYRSAALGHLLERDFDAILRDASGEDVAVPSVRQDAGLA
jgi:dolichyl-phosphate beta-glucosyltransferase